MLPRTILLLYFVTNSFSKYTYRIEHMDVPLDHFSFSDNRTFSLKYVVNDSYWKQNNGPIFFYTGNEGDIEMFAQNTGFLWESAVEFNALVVFAEHRYYGKSLPFGNLSFTDPKYFGYLTSEQALADFVDVIYRIKSTQKLEDKRNPVIAFGGSYGGMLAAWMRMKYPAVIEGSLASSGPIWLFTGLTPCKAFYDVTTAVYNSTSSECASNIRKSWNIIKNFTNTEKGKAKISKIWNLCERIKTGEDVNALIDWLVNTYISLALINYPYATSFLMPVPANPVKEMCSYLNDSSLSDEDLLLAVFKAVSIYFNYTGNAKCMEWKSDPSTGLGVEGWNIQSCTEMVMPMCTNGETDMFKPSEWNFTSYSETCFKNYHVNPKEYVIQKIYGGKEIKTASNIIFSNGLLDPWMSGGVTHSVSPTAIAVLLQESAHHLDLREANENDPISVVNARKLYKSLFKKWIHNYYKRIRSLNVNTGYDVEVISF